MRKNGLYVILLMTLLLMMAPQSSVLSISPEKVVRSHTIASDPMYIDSDYTFTEDISMPIEVIADNVVIDGAGYKLVGPGGDTTLRGLLVIGRSKVTIKNIVVEGWDWGIVVHGGYKNKILYNTIRDCNTGVDVTLCEKTRIYGNTASENKDVGFFANECSKDHYQGNTANYNGWTGFQILNSFQSRFMDNTAIGNVGNGFLISDYSAENYFTGNYASDTGRCYWLHTTTHDNTLVDNSAYMSNDGIHLSGSDSNSLIRNTICDCGNAFYLQDSSHNHIENNHIDYITKNDVDSVILAGESEFNYIYDNIFEGNVASLAFFDNSENNYFYHNNFIAAVIKLRSLPLSCIEDNFLYNPFLNVGNYWSDYTGLDLDSDGIGDTEVPWHYDLYPYMKQDGWKTSP